MESVIAHTDRLWKSWLNLNELPRGNRDGCVPREAAPLLFAPDCRGGLAIR